MEKKINRFFVVSLILGVLFGVAAYLVRDYPHASEAGGEYFFPKLEYIDIDLQRLGVELIPCDGDEIIVEYKNDRPLLMEVGDNTLTVTESSDFVVSLFAGKRSEFGVKIYLPDKIYREITVYTATGAINVYGIDCLKLSAVTESGDINIEKMDYLASLVTTSGNIRADITDVINDTDILNRSGDIELYIPPNSSVAIDFKTENGECITDMISGQIYGDFLYAFNGGKRQISVTAAHGTLVFREGERVEQSDEPVREEPPEQPEEPENSENQDRPALW